jgi:hypothetical protein
MARPNNLYFLGAVTAALITALVIGAMSSPPRQGVPAYALQSPLVYRLEIGIAFFLAFYAVVVLVRLAAYGLTPSRIATAAIHLPQLARAVETVEEDLETRDRDIDDMLAMVRSQEERIDANRRATVDDD